MFKGLKAFFTDNVLLKKYAAVIIGLAVFRLIASIPIPQVDESTISTLLYQNQLLGAFNLFSGGGLSNFSIAMLGVFPYITVSIVVQLLTVVSTKIHSLYHEEGEIGRKKVGQWTRIVTIPVATLNAIGILYYLQSQGAITSMPLPDFAMSVLFIVTGTVLAMWIGELITEFGIGNGISFIIFAGIVVNIPTLITQLITTYSPTLITSYAIGAIGIVIGFMVAVWMNEADRPIPVTYARYGIGYGSNERRAKTYIPIKVNPVGVLSIIFALTVMAFIQFGFTFLGNLEGGGMLQSIGAYIGELLTNGFYYAIPVALLTMFFTYFHAPIVFNTKKIAENLQNQGAFIPGIRPGEDTKIYFTKVLKHIIFYAAAFLVIVAALPYLITGSTAGTFIFAIGGTGALIIVHIVLDVYKKTKERLSA